MGHPARSSRDPPDISVILGRDPNRATPAGSFSQTWQCSAVQVELAHQAREVLRLRLAQRELSMNNFRNLHGNHLIAGDQHAANPLPNDHGVTAMRQLH